MDRRRDPPPYSTYGPACIYTYHAANLTHSSLTAEKDDGEDTSCLQADTSSQKLAGSRHYVYICVRTSVRLYILNVCLIA
jgi:hypothetical protein